MKEQGPKSELEYLNDLEDKEVDELVEKEKPKLEPRPIIDYQKKKRKEHCKRILGNDN
jgi:hypothetical protein